MTDTRTVGYQGERGAFSEAAAQALAPGLRPEPRRSFADVVRATERGEDAAGVLPVENTLAGGVTAAFDALLDGDVQAVMEVALPIRHALLALPGSDLSALSEVRSHPVALAQCRRFFETHPSIAPVPVHDTAGAAREVSELQDPTVAALAGGHAAAAYGLEILADDLQDRDDNQTRFLLVTRPGHEDASPGLLGTPSAQGTTGRGTWKTGLSVEIHNRPGALRDLLDVFADRGLDLTFITSRPTGVPWTYRFILEFRHDTHEAGAEGIEAATSAARTVRVFGTYGAVGSADGLSTSTP